MVRNSFEIGRERSTEKDVISVDRHFVLVLTEMEEVRSSLVVIESQHYKLLREAERGDFS